MDKNFVSKSVTLFFIGLLFVLALYMLKIIIIPILLGLLLTYFFYPVYVKINKYIKNKDVSAFILIFAIVFAIAIPLWFLTPMLVRQIFESYMYMQKINFGELFQNVFPSLFNEEIARTFYVNINNILTKLFNSLLSQGSEFVSNLPNIILQGVVTLFTFYFSTRDADKLKDYFLKLSPFSPSTERKFIEEFTHITNAIVYGQFLIAAVQGLLLGVGLYVLGVDNVLLLTAMTMLVSVIPVFGAWLVWLPVSIYLITSGQVFNGVVLFLYGALIVSTVDNLLRIYLLSRKSSLSTAVSLIGIIGGIYAFGLVGILLGPLILAYTLIIVEFYRQGKLDDLFKPN
ncbi:MAG: AI-2E family transporter [Nanoarchaeota archaeon]|nr:AI-2E family transporter [Nanoarchaeota archaeon]